MSDLMLSAVLNMPLPDDPSQMDVLTWMQFRDRARQSADEINRLRAVNERLQHLSHCCVCGNPVDTREECDGGGPDGCQLTDDRWVCTSECWDKVVKTIDLQNELDRLRAENERMMEALGLLDGQLDNHGFSADGPMRRLISRTLTAIQDKGGE